MQTSWKLFQEAEALKRQEERSKQQEKQGQNEGKKYSKWYLFQQPKEKVTNDISALGATDQTVNNASTA
jgi:hypothetical protein